MLEREAFFVACTGKLNENKLWDRNGHKTSVCRDHQVLSQASVALCKDIYIFFREQFFSPLTEIQGHLRNKLGALFETCVITFNLCSKVINIFI